MSIVAIVGRPNVGKSTLFNKIIGHRKALVSDMPGVTRDRHYGRALHADRNFVLVDTGGLCFDESDAVESQVHKQSISAMEEAEVVICLFDGRDGLTPLDRDIVEIFRKSPKKIIYAVNKIDTPTNEALTVEFSALGVDVFPVSAEHGSGVYELLDRVVEILPEPPPTVQRSEDGLKIAIVGRPNVGKSTLINRLANEERVVVHELAGTTRDTIDVEVIYRDKRYIFVDTSGIKKRTKTNAAIDKFATIKSLKTIDDADIVLVIFDADQGFARQDITLAAYAFNAYKPTAILINKWDIAKDPLNKEEVKGKRGEAEFIKYIRHELRELGELPILLISGKTGLNCEKIFGFAQRLISAGNYRVKTAELNRFLKHLTMNHPPPDSGNRHVRLNYITQVEVSPPVFIVFTNLPEGIKKSYKKYVANGLRGLISDIFIPIIVRFREKS